MTEAYFSVFNPETQHMLEQQTKGEMLRKLGRSLQTMEIAKTLTGIAREGMENSTLSLAEQDIMAVLHGEYARPLGDKSVFPHLLRSIGYSAPESLLIGQTITPNDRVQESMKYYQERGINHVFCKPLNGSRQRDLRDFDIHDPQFREYISAGAEDLLVQEYMPHEKVLRYIRYKDADGKSFIGCFTYEEDTSQTKKPYALPVIGNRNLPGSGETINELFTSMRDTKAVPLANDNHQLDNLNSFMDTLIAKLEEKLGGKLPFFTCDIGIKQLHDLEGEYNEAKLKDTAVFFESQGLPNPWAGVNKTDRADLKSYVNVWRLFLKEHGSDMVKRARNVREKRKQDIHSS